MNKASVKIDFVNFSEYVDESISYPMGILYISACLKRSGFTNVGYVDHICMLRKMEETKNDPSRKFMFKGMPETRQNNLDDLFKYLKERQPHIILLGPITSFHLVELTDLIPQLREQLAEQLIIAGGPHFGKENSLDTELLKTCTGLDAIIVGEAEETVVEVASLYQRNCGDNETLFCRGKFKNKLSEILGVRTRDNVLKPRSPPKLENMPSPDMDLLETYWKAPKIRTYYNYSITNRRNPTFRVSRGIFEGDDGDWGAIEDDVKYFDNFRSRSERFPFGVIVGSRGCPYKCGFCCSSGNRRVHTAEYVFNQIVDLNRKYGIRQFVFFDPLFTTSAKVEIRRVEKLCNMICKSGLNIIYAIEIRADTVLQLPEGLLSLMMCSGCVEFNIGFEKGSDRLLNKMMKSMTTRTHHDAVNKLRQVANVVGREVLVNGTFIIGGPGENQNDVRETLIHSLSLSLDETAFYPLEIHPGTECYKDALLEGILKPGLAPYLNPEEYPIYSAPTVFDFETLSRCYLFDVRKLGKTFLNEFDEWKGKIQEIERQFLPENKRDGFSKFDIERTKKLQECSEACIEKLLGYENECAKVEKEIESVEKELLKKYPNYHPYYWDYHPGDLLEEWNELLKRLEQLFQAARKKIRVHREVYP